MALRMLDTDTVSFLIRGRHPALDARVAAAAPRQLCISAVTRGELLLGVRLKDGAHHLARLVDQALLRLPCLPWDAAAATAFAEVAERLQRAGTPIGSMDTLIASHALATRAVLVTHNTRHFARVEGLRLEDWTVPG